MRIRLHFVTVPKPACLVTGMWHLVRQTCLPDSSFFLLDNREKVSMLDLNKSLLTTRSMTWSADIFIIIKMHDGFMPQSVKQKHQVRLTLSSSPFISNFLTLKSSQQPISSTKWHGALGCKKQSSKHSAHSLPEWETMCFPWKDERRNTKNREEDLNYRSNFSVKPHVTFQNYTLTTASKFGTWKCVYCNVYFL